MQKIIYLFVLFLSVSFLFGCTKVITLDELNNSKVKAYFGKYEGEVFWANITHYTIKGKEITYLQLENKKEVILPVEYIYTWNDKPEDNVKRKVPCYFELRKTWGPPGIEEIMVENVGYMQPTISAVPYKNKFVLFISNKEKLQKNFPRRKVSLEDE